MRATHAGPTSLVLPAFGKINLDLRVLGVRPDGFHDLRTVFQALQVHDVVTLTRRPGPFEIACDDPRVPTDQRNLVWKAAALLWQVAARRRAREPRDVHVALQKRIPAEAGLGGGSADAAVTLLGLSRLWDLAIDMPTLSRLGARLGADIPFFLVGGTALGLGRGDDIYPLTDMPRTHVVIIRPPFGVSTVEAYQWFDREPRRLVREPARRRIPVEWPDWAMSLRNDLEPPVFRHHPTIARIKHALLDAGAVVAAMSGSGSAVFGLFDRLDAARRASADLARPGWQVTCTRTVSRAEYGRRLAPALAGFGRARIS
jgi:4-diphosphocytidyl-2-C-methyl-D-erythritol kinase